MEDPSGFGVGLVGVVTGFAGPELPNGFGLGFVGPFVAFAGAGEDMIDGKDIWDGIVMKREKLWRN